MSRLTNLLFTILGIYAGIYIMTAIMQFFEIKFSTYGVYMFYIAVILLFANILPTCKINIFDPTTYSLNNSGSSSGNKLLPKSLGLSDG